VTATSIRSWLGPMLLGLFLAGGGCDPDDDSALPPGDESAACVVNSDCAQPLICAFQRCHVECVKTRDCTGTLRCVGAQAAARVCQLADEAACQSSDDCELGFACAQDEQCRETCRHDDDCTPGQRCAAGACAETRELDERGQLPRIASFTSCGRDADCGSRQRCVAQTCLAECRGDRDCPSGKSCTEGTCRGEAPPCTDDSECTEAGQSCIQNECYCACVEDVDCAAGQTCDGCGCQAAPEPECRVDLECDPGERCIDGECDCECHQNRDCAPGRVCNGCSCQNDPGPTVVHDAVIGSALDIGLMRGVSEVQETLTLSGNLSSTAGLESLRRVNNLTLDNVTLDYTKDPDPLLGLAGLVEITGTLTIKGAGVKKLSFNSDLRIGTALVLSNVELSCAEAVAFQVEHQLEGTFDVQNTSDCMGKCGPGTCE
jgi:hypothetical protein